MHILFAPFSCSSRRWFSEFLEISRCLAYFAFDYYLIYTTEWDMGSNVRLLFNYSMWSVRLFHVLSIIFWLGNFGVRLCVHGRVFNISPSESNDDIVKSLPNDNHNGEAAVAAAEVKKGAIADLMKLDDAEMLKAGSIPRRPNKFSFSTAMLMLSLLIGSVLAFVPLYVLSVPSCKRWVETF